jgi:uncharacterized protein (DUF2236 family)
VLLVEEVRDWIRDEIQRRVIGDNANAKAASIREATGPRWFEVDSPIWVVHGDTSMFVGGLRALLLQSLHPLAMAGVAQHSDYRDDPWGRLQRTADFLANTTFGTVEQAEKSIAIVHRVHERVVGVASDGRRYSANDPILLSWVHCVEVDSFMRAHQRHGEQPLDAAGYDEYVAQTAVIAERLGVIEPPRSVEELRFELREFRPELRSTPEARDAARYLLWQPPLPAAAKAPYAVLAAAATALLPAWARFPLRLPLLPVTERLVVRQAGTALTQVIRWATTRPSPA